MNLNKIIEEWRNFLLESKMKNKFNIEIDDEVYRVIRDYHVRQSRNGTIPRDAGMSTNKYKKIIELSIDDIQDGNTYTITWTDKGKNNAISITRIGYDINVFGAIIKSKDKIEKLYTVAEKRINLGEISF